MSFLTSGELAKQTAVNAQTLRYYEREGLLPEPKRTEGGYRMYQGQDVRRVRFIRRAQELGFSLSEIRELLALQCDVSQSAGAVKEIATRKIQMIDDKIQALKAIRETLAELATACPGEAAPVEDCPILGCLERACP